MQSSEADVGAPPQVLALVGEEADYLDALCAGIEQLTIGGSVDAASVVPGLATLGALLGRSRAVGSDARWRGVLARGPGASACATLDDGAARALTVRYDASGRARHGQLVCIGEAVQEAEFRVVHEAAGWALRAGSGGRFSQVALGDAAARLPWAPADGTSPPARDDGLGGLIAGLAVRLEGRAAVVAPSPPAPVWYYTSGGQQVGPVSEIDLQRLVAEQRLPADTLAWNPSMSGWQEIARCGLLPTPVPTPATFCTACGARLDAGARFCARCGGAVGQP